MPARWPNARLDDGSLWDMPATWRHQHPDSTLGRMIDDDTPGNTDRLADTRIDFTDAIAIMNIGSWLSWAQRIERHEPGSDRFTYHRDMSRSGRSMARAAENFLGSEEWWGKKEIPLPGIHSNNFVGDVRTQLRDADNRDFRPRQGSELIDAGIPTEGVKAAFLGRAPDIGPYEFGDENYWIPGRKFPRPSTPIPPDGTMSAKTTADLMWLGAYRAATHDVYFGHDRKAVAEAGPGAPEYRGNRTNNIFHPKSLQQKKTYYWRVDGVSDSTTTRGDVWTFTTQ